MRLFVEHAAYSSKTLLPVPFIVTLAEYLRGDHV